jgi:hypothetical protein
MRPEDPGSWRLFSYPVGVLDGNPRLSLELVSYILLGYSVFLATLLLSITALFREPKAREDHPTLTRLFKSTNIHKYVENCFSVLPVFKKQESVNHVRIGPVWPFLKKGNCAS